MRGAVLATLAAAGVLLAPAVSADTLDPYRTLARDPAATRLLVAARAAMHAHFGGTDVVPAMPPAPDWPAAPSGLYLTLADGRATRACVGAATPPAGTLAESIRHLAVQALQFDRRRAPVRADELDRLRIVIAFASAPQPIADPWSLAPMREGLLVTTARGSVAFLPGEARTIAWALREARRAGLGDLRDAGFARFDVVTLAEPPSHPARGRAARSETDSDESP